MSLERYAESVVDLTTSDRLAEVIQLRPSEPDTYYQRRSGALPRLGSGTEARYTRSSLPTPVAPETTNMRTRVMECLRVNRPSWLPQR